MKQGCSKVLAQHLWLQGVTLAGMPSSSPVIQPGPRGNMCLAREFFCVWAGAEAGKGRLSHRLALRVHITFQAVAQGWGERAQPEDTSEVQVLYCMHPTQPSAPRSLHNQDFPASRSRASAFTEVCGSPEPARHWGKNDSSAPSALLGAGLGTRQCQQASQVGAVPPEPQPWCDTSRSPSSATEGHAPTWDLLSPLHAPAGVVLGTGTVCL